MSFQRHEKTNAIRRMLMDMAPFKQIRLQLHVDRQRIQHQVQEMELKRVYLTTEEELLIKNNRKKLLQAGHKW